MYNCDIFGQTQLSNTYDHRLEIIAADPVRSPVLKLETGGLVARWVITGESPLSYVFVVFFIAV